MLDGVPVDYKAVDIVASSDNEPVDFAASSDKSETSSKLDAKYEASIRSLGHPLCNGQFEKYYLLQCPPITVNSKTVAMALNTHKVLRSMVQDTWTECP